MFSFGTIKRGSHRKVSLRRRRQRITRVALEHLEVRSLLTASPTQTTLQLSSLSILAGQSLAETATVQGTNNQHPTGNVDFYDGSTKVGSSALSSSGQATFSTSSLPVGSDILTAVYDGSATSAASTSPAVTESVSSVPTITSLSSSAPSVYVGHSVTFTGGVSESGENKIPTGTVQFFSGSTDLGSATLSSGSAKFTTNALMVGTQAITAVYEGDATNQTSTSTSLNQSVLPVPSTTTQLSASSTGDLFGGQSVTFTAVISAIDGSGQVPTGVVNFYDGTAALASVLVGANGQAVFETAGLCVGSHQISCTYSGDSLDLPSAAAAIAITVNASPTATSLSTSAPTNAARLE
jgi:hypothetical protein